jgi:hypothetical protein
LLISVETFEGIVDQIEHFFAFQRPTSVSVVLLKYAIDGLTQLVVTGFGTHFIFTCQIYYKISFKDLIKINTNAIKNFRNNLKEILTKILILKFKQKLNNLGEDGNDWILVINSKNWQNLR